MPANLPAEAKAKWLKVMNAKTAEEKLEALKEFLSSVPKHKGTEKVVMHAKRQMATLRREIELEKRKRKRRGGGFFVEKEGDVQLVLVGYSNSGKTFIFNKLTGTELTSSETPLETKRPTPGIIKWSGVYLQIIDTPSLIPNASQGEFSASKILALARNADALILVIDLCSDVLSQAITLEKELEKARITIRASRVKVRIERRSSGGIVLKGDLSEGTLNDVIKLLRSYGIYHALIEINGKATLDDIEEGLFKELNYKPVVVIATKSDLCGESRLAKLINYFNEIPVFKYIPGKEEYLKEQIATSTMKLLNLIRVYTRNPKTGKIEERPLVLRKGAKVMDVAKAIHSRLYKNFRYSKVWSKRLRFSPQKVGKEFELEDGDIIEIVA